MKIDERKWGRVIPFWKQKTNLAFLLLLLLLTGVLIWQQCQIVDLQERMMHQEAADYGTHIGSLYWHAGVTDEKFKDVEKDIRHLQKHSTEHDWALQERNW